MTRRRLKGVGLLLLPIVVAVFLAIAADQGWLSSWVRQLPAAKRFTTELIRLTFGWIPWWGWLVVIAAAILPLGMMLRPRFDQLRDHYTLCGIRELCEIPGIVTPVFVVAGPGEPIKSIRRVRYRVNHYYATTYRLTLFIPMGSPDRARLLDMLSPHMSHHALEESTLTCEVFDELNDSGWLFRDGYVGEISQNRSRTHLIVPLRFYKMNAARSIH